MEYNEEEYEVIPTSPIRRLEKRISRMEGVSSSSETRRLIEQIIELIKSNQRIIDDVIKADAELRHELSAIPGRIDELIANIHEFIDILRASASEEAGGKESLDPLLKKISEMVEQNKKTQEIGQATLTSLETIDKRLKRVLVQSPALYRGQQ